MRVGEACNRTVVVATADTAIVEAAQLMRQYHVGTLVVVERDGQTARPVGMVTDRDVVVEVVAKEVPLERVVLGDIMSTEITIANEDDDLLETLDRMRDRGVRRMPVIGQGGALIGILAVDDVLELLAETIGRIPQLVRFEQQVEARHRP
ncbi:MAG: CBS domain-containing protein [Nevskia sp.]|nr:CBS domain-containing protein [Nevskia sp.]